MADLAAKLAAMDAKHTADRERVTRQHHAEEALAPIGEATTYDHRDHIGAKFGETFRQARTLAEAVAIVERITAEAEPVDCERWRNGHLSSRPAAINKDATNPRATRDGVHAVELLAEAIPTGGGGFNYYASLVIWARKDGLLFECKVPFAYHVPKMAPAFLPRMVGHYTKHGDYQGKAEVCNIGEDSRTQWGTGGPGCRVSFYFADLHNFRAWASQFVG